MLFFILLGSSSSLFSLFFVSLQRAFCIVVNYTCSLLFFWIFYLLLTPFVRRPISASDCVQGTRTQPLICVGRSVHYWVPCTINKEGFCEIAFVVVVDTHLPCFKALAYVLPHFDQLPVTHVLIRASSSVCWGLLFCLCKAFIFYKFAESSLSVHISRVSWRFTIDLCLLNLSKRSSFKSLSRRCATK